MAEPYWCADYEFSNSYDDELWPSAMTGVVANIGETELLSPSSSSSPVAPVAKTIIVPQQWGDASICWYSALRACWTEAKLLPAQEELARDGLSSASMEPIPQGSAPVKPIDPSSSPTPGPRADDIPPWRNRPPGPNGTPPGTPSNVHALARTYCVHEHCGNETTWDNRATMSPPEVCGVCFGYTSEQCALMHGSCSNHLEALWCSHEHYDNEITWDDRTWNDVEQVWEFLICYSCL